MLRLCAARGKERGSEYRATHRSVRASMMRPEGAAAPGQTEAGVADAGS